MPIRIRKLIGTVALLVLVSVWGLLAMALAQSVLTDINGFVAAIYYVVAGLGWVLPAMPLISWMAKPDAPRGKLRGVDAAEAVPHRGGGARHQNLQIALLLEIAVDRNAWQRGQMVAVRLEQYARPPSEILLQR